MLDKAVGGEGPLTAPPPSKAKAGQTSLLSKCTNLSRVPAKFPLVPHPSLVKAGASEQ